MSALPLALAAVVMGSSAFAAEGGACATRPSANVDAQSRFQKACASLERGHLPAAHAGFDAALALDSRFLDAYAHRAVVLSLRGQGAQASVDYYESRKAFGPEGASRTACPCGEVAARGLRRLAEAARSGAESRASAIALFLKGDKAGARRALDKALSIDPGDCEAFQSRAVVREAAGDWRGALADYEKGLEFSARRPDFHEGILASRNELRRKWRKALLADEVAALSAALAAALKSAAPRSIWHKPAAAWLFLFLVPPMVLALARILRGGAAAACVFAVFAGAAALARIRHGFITGSWYVDYLGPVDGVVAPVTHVRAGLAGLLRCLPALPISPENLVFALSLGCSSLAIGMLTAALWRYQQRQSPRWPPYAALVWGLFLSSDATLTYLGSSDAHHNVGLLAFSLGFWWYGEVLAQSHPDNASARPLRVALGMTFLCSLFVGLSRMELLLSPLAIPLLMPARKTGFRAGGKKRVWLALGLGMLAAWLVIRYRSPWRQIAMFQPGSFVEFVGFFWGQFPLNDVERLPPFLLQPHLSRLFLVYLFWAICREVPSLGVVGAYTVLILPKIMGGFGSSALYCCDDSQRYNIILIPIMLLMAALGVSGLLEWLVSWGRRLRGARWFFLAAGLIVYAGIMMRDAADWRRSARPPLPHQAEFYFLTRHLSAVPRGGTVLAVWLERLSDGRDADTQLAVPHALLVHARPDIRWVVQRQGEPLPIRRPFLFYKSASCSMDAAQGVATGQDSAADRSLLHDIESTCRYWERRTSRWEAQERIGIREATVHIKGQQLDLGLGWVLPDEKPGAGKL